MNGFKSNIEKDTLGNKNFRKVLYTGKHLQLVLMTLKPKEDIGLEVHADHDQFFRIEHGTGKCSIDGKLQSIKTGDAILVPAGAEHNIKNTSSKEDLKLYTIYGPPNHLDGTIRLTKQDAEDKPEEFDGKTTE